MDNSLIWPLDFLGKSSWAQNLGLGSMWNWISLIFCHVTCTGVTNCSRKFTWGYFRTTIPRKDCTIPSGSLFWGWQWMEGMGARLLTTRLILATEVSNFLIWTALRCSLQLTNKSWAWPNTLLKYLPTYQTIHSLVTRVTGSFNGRNSSQNCN